jgi:hypothetical protein
VSSFPSKTFLLGEYCVLEGAPALLLAHEPMFRAEFHPDPQAASPFQVGSPAARLSERLGLDPRRFSFLDPHEGKGGFGASGAEFLAVARQDPAAPGSRSDFAWYAREAYLRLGDPGSGADLLVQAFAESSGLVSVGIGRHALEMLPARLGALVTLFRTGRKLPTHEHLRETGRASVRELCLYVEQARAACLAGNLEAFADAVKAFGGGLEKRGLLADHSAKALRGLGNGPLAAKGCGAMGSDVLLVLSRAPLHLARWAKDHSLVEVARVGI